MQSTVLVKLITGLKTYYYADSGIVINDNEGYERQYRPLIESVGDYNSEIDLESSVGSIGTVAVTINNVDRLQDVCDSVPLENSEAEVSYVFFNDDGTEIGRVVFSGLASEVSWEYGASQKSAGTSIINITLKDSITKLFGKVPMALLTKDSFEERVVFVPNDSDVISRASRIDMFVLGGNMEAEGYATLSTNIIVDNAVWGGDEDEGVQRAFAKLNDGSTFSSYIRSGDLFYFRNLPGNVIRTINPGTLTVDGKVPCAWSRFANYKSSPPAVLVYGPTEAGLSGTGGTWYVLPGYLDQIFTEKVTSSDDLGVVGNSELFISFENPRMLTQYAPPIAATADWIVPGMMLGLDAGYPISDLGIRSGDLLFVYGGDGATYEFDKNINMRLSDIMPFEELNSVFVIDYVGAIYGTKKPYVRFRQWISFADGSTAPKLSLTTGLRASIDNISWEIRRGGKIVSDMTIRALGKYASGYWNGSRLDVIKDVDTDGIDTAANDPDNPVGEYAMVKSFVSDGSDGALTFNSGFKPLQGDTGEGILDITLNRLYNAKDTSTYMMVKHPLPEDSDSDGVSYPIVYGRVEKMVALWAISTMPGRVRGDLPGAGNDFYILAGHEISDTIDGMLVYWGLDEKPDMTVARAGQVGIATLSNPFPGEYKNTEYPFHKVESLYDNDGNYVVGIRLRGDEYSRGTVVYNDAVSSDGTSMVSQPAVDDDASPFYPIRNGIGRSKLFVTFRGHKDDSLGTVTGVPNAFIENAVDVIFHWVMNYTSATIDDIDINSFRKARALRDNWKFACSITEDSDSDEILERFCQQAACVWYRTVDNKIGIRAVDLTTKHPELLLQNGLDIADISFSRSGSNIKTEVLLKYGWDYVTDKPRATLRRNHKNDRICRDALSFYKREQSITVEAPDINDDITANLFVDFLVRFHCMQHTPIVTELFFNDRTMALANGMVVSVQSPLGFGVNGWVKRACMITAMKIGRAGMSANMIDLGYAFDSNIGDIPSTDFRTISTDEPFA